MAAFLFPKPLSDVSPQLLLIINGMLMPPVGAVGGGAANGGWLHLCQVVWSSEAPN